MIAAKGLTRSRRHHSPRPRAFVAAKRSISPTETLGALRANSKAPVSIQAVPPTWLPNQPPAFHRNRPGPGVGSWPAIAHPPHDDPSIAHRVFVAVPWGLPPLRPPGARIVHDRPICGKVRCRIVT